MNKTYFYLLSRIKLYVCTNVHLFNIKSQLVCMECKYIETVKTSRHSDIRVTEIYSHLRTEGLREKHQHFVQLFVVQIG